MTATAVVLPAPADWVRAVTDGTERSAEEAESVFWAAIADAVAAAAEGGGPMVVYDADATLEGKGNVPDWLGTEYPVISGSAVAFSDVPGELARRHGEASVALVAGTCPLLGRRHVDAGAMRLRRNGVVIGADQTADWYYLGTSAELAASVDPTARPRELATWGTEAGADVDFMPMLPVVRDADSLAVIEELLAAHAVARTAAAPTTRATLERLGIIDPPVPGGE